MEELGIGRPSTYASIISVLQNRSYVRLEQKRFVPEDKGWLVNAFLVEKFGHWVEYDFTAQLEDQLDDVAGGSRIWKDVLREFWVPFAARLAEVGEQRQREVIDALDHALGPLLFPPATARPTRACARAAARAASASSSAASGRSSAARAIPTATTRARSRSAAARRRTARRSGPTGCSASTPRNAEEVWLKIGRFGPYVQRGSGAEAKRSSLPPGVAARRARPRHGAQAARAAARGRPRSRDQASRSWPGINRYGPFVQLGEEVRAAGARRRRADGRHEPGAGAA